MKGMGKEALDGGRWLDVLRELIEWRTVDLYGGKKDLLLKRC